MSLPFPVIKIVDHIENTVDLHYSKAGQTHGLDGTYILRAGIASPQVDSIGLTNGAMVIAGYNVHRGITQVIAEWQWADIEDTIIDSDLVESGGWRHLAEAWLHFGIRSWLWTEQGDDMNPHRHKLRIPELDFGVAIRGVSLDVKYSVTAMVRDLQQKRLFIPQEDKHSPTSPLAMAITRTRPDKTPPPPVLAAIAALKNLNKSASHYRRDHRHH